MKNGSVWQKFWFHLVWDILPIALVLDVLRIMLMGVTAHAQSVDPCAQWGRDLAGNRVCMATDLVNRNPIFAETHSIIGSGAVTSSRQPKCPEGWTLVATPVAMCAHELRTPE